MVLSSTSSHNHVTSNEGNESVNKTYCMRPRKCCLHKKINFIDKYVAIYTFMKAWKWLLCRKHEWFFFMFWSTCINLCTKKYMLLPQSLSFSVFVLCLALTKKQMGENTTFTAQYEYAAFNWWRTRQLLWWWVMKPQRSGGSSTYRETEKGLFMLETEESIAKKIF